MRAHNHPPNTGSLAQAFRQVSSLRAQLTHAAADLAALHELVAISGGGGGGEIEAAAAAAAAMVDVRAAARQLQVRCDCRRGPARPAQPGRLGPARPARCEVLASRWPGPG